MERLRVTGDLDGLRRMVERVLEMVEYDGSAEVRLTLRHVLASAERLGQAPAPSESVIALGDVCHFLRVRGGGLAARRV